MKRMLFSLLRSLIFVISPLAYSFEGSTPLDAGQVAHFENLFDKDVSNFMSGTWSSGFVDVGGVLFNKVEMTFESDRLILNDHYIINIPFLPEYYSKLTIHLKLLSIGKLNDETLFVVLVEDRFFDTSYSQEDVDEKNLQSYCGFSDWELGVPKELTGLVCETGFEDKEPISYIVDKTPILTEIPVGPGMKTLNIPAEYFFGMEDKDLLDLGIVFELSRLDEDF